MITSNGPNKPSLRMQCADRIPLYTAVNRKAIRACTPDHQGSARFQATPATEPAARRTACSTNHTMCFLQLPMRLTLEGSEQVTSSSEVTELVCTLDPPLPILKSKIHHRSQNLRPAYQKPYFVIIIGP
jgi:hypothetical protein